MAAKKNEDNWTELDSLAALFEDTLTATTKARKILTISNQETFGLLTNWEIPEASNFPYEEPVCSCNLTSSKGEAAVVTESQPRLKVKQEDILSTVPCTSTTAELKSVQKTSLPSKLVTQKMSETTISRLPSKCSKVQKESKMPQIRQQSSLTRLCSKKEISAQDSYTFNEDESPSKQIPLQSSPRSSFAQRPVALSQNESKKFNKISPGQACVNTCPVHGSGKQSSGVNLEEALEVLGVPPEMVKYLRSYHNLVLQFQCEDKPTKTSKGRRAAENFIGQLAEVNGRQWRGAEEEPLGSLFQECVPLFAEVFGTEELNPNIEERVKTLDKRCLKLCNVNEFVDASVYSDDEIHSPLQDNLLLNGIWNFKYKRLPKVFQYIRYSNPIQWKNLFKNMQDIQRLDLQLQVFTELENIIPVLLMCSPDDPSFILLFKAICTMCDVSKLCLPVTFKS